MCTFQLGFDRFIPKFKAVLAKFLGTDEANQYGNVGLQFFGTFLSSFNDEDENSKLFKDTITYLLNVSFCSGWRSLFSNSSSILIRTRRSLAHRRKFAFAFVNL